MPTLVLTLVLTQAHQRPGDYTDLQALSWCLDIAKALKYLHTQDPPIVHRDVKCVPEGPYPCLKTCLGTGVSLFLF